MGERESSQSSSLHKDRKETLHNTRDLVVRWVLVKQITSRWGKHIPGYTYCFNLPLLSTFDHFYWFLWSRVYGWVLYMYGLFLNCRSNMSLCNLFMNVRKPRKTIQRAFVSGLIAIDLHWTQWDCVRIRNCVIERCAFCIFFFSPSSQTYKDV